MKETNWSKGYMCKRCGIITPHGDCHEFCTSCGEQDGYDVVIYRWVKKGFFKSPEIEVKFLSKKQ